MEVRTTKRILIEWAIALAGLAFIIGFVVAELCC
jgi:hypothetical protein